MLFESKNFSVESRDIVKEYQPGSREFMKKLKDDNCLNEDFCNSTNVVLPENIQLWQTVNQKNFLSMAYNGYLYFEHGTGQ